MDPLPFIDEHSRRIAAPAEAVWAAVLEVVRRETAGGGAFVRLLGCDPAVASGTFTGRAGETVPGFRVAEAEAGRRLVLCGRHRFARYALTFVLEDSSLKAQTHAEFPGLQGRLYRAAVIGSGAHAVVTRGLLRKVARVVGWKGSRPVSQV